MFNYLYSWLNKLTWLNSIFCCDTDIPMIHIQIGQWSACVLGALLPYKHIHCQGNSSHVIPFQPTKHEIRGTSCMRTDVRQHSQKAEDEMQDSLFTLSTASARFSLHWAPERLDAVWRFSLTHWPTFAERRACKAPLKMIGLYILIHAGNPGKRAIF